jgi:hypothetical protein
MRVKTGLLVLAVLAVAVLPAVGDPIAVTGNITYGFTTDFTTSPLVATDTLDVNLTFTGNIDDWITGYALLTYAKQDLVASLAATSVTTIANEALEAAYIKTNLGKFFELGDVGLILQGGYTSRSDNSYGSTTAYGSEDIGSAGVGTNWMFFVDASYSTYVTMTFAMSPTQANDWLIGAYTNQTLGFGVVSAEVFYDAASQANAADGNLIIDGQVQPTFGDIKLDIGAGFRYSLAGAGSYAWGAGIGAGYMTLFDVNAGVYGNSTDMLAGVVADLIVSPAPLIDILAGVKLSTAAGTNLFTGMDIAARFNIGAADLYLGYLITSAAGGAVWAPVSPTNGGLYIKMYAAF